MDVPNDRYVILDGSNAARPTTRREFVEFWADRYDVPYDRPYAENIAGRKTEETFRKLWLWKIGRKGLFDYQWGKCLFPHFISKLEKAARLPPDPEKFLKEFPGRRTNLSHILAALLVPRSIPNLRSARPSCDDLHSGWND